MALYFTLWSNVNAGNFCWYGDCQFDGSFCNNNAECKGELVPYEKYDSSKRYLCVNGVNYKGCTSSWFGSTERSNHPAQGSYCIKGDCISKPTPVNGGWTSFGSCPTCAPSGYVLTRTCTNPSPANGGANCSGPSVQTCDVPVCVAQQTDNGCLTDAEYNSIDHCDGNRCSTRTAGYRCDFENRSLLKPCPFKKAVASIECVPPLGGGIAAIGSGNLQGLLNNNIDPTKIILIGGCFASCTPGEDTRGGTGGGTGGGGGSVVGPGGPPIGGPEIIIPGDHGGPGDPTGGGSNRNPGTGVWGDSGDSPDGSCPTCASKDYSTA